VRVHRHASPLTDIDSRNTRFRESLPPRIIFMRVHRDGHTHENNVAARYATLFSWRFFWVFRESSPSWSYFVRVEYFVRAHRHEVISWEYGIFVRAHRHEVILWVCISWELNVMKLFRERLGFRESSPSWSYFVSVYFMRAQRHEVISWEVGFSWEFQNSQGK
jgi:hypothetical protein